MKIAALLAITLMVPALDSDRLQIRAADLVWLQSDRCTPELAAVDPDGMQCALERALKEQLRQGPIDVGPAE